MCNIPQKHGAIDVQWAWYVAYECPARGTKAGREVPTGLALVNDPIASKTSPSCRKFSEEFLSTFAGQKIPKEGTCFDYFYDWQSDGFKEWSTKVRVSVHVEVLTNKMWRSSRLHESHTSHRPI